MEDSMEQFFEWAKREKICPRIVFRNECPSSALEDRVFRVMNDLGANAHKGVLGKVLESLAVDKVFDENLLCQGYLRLPHNLCLNWMYIIADYLDNIVNAFLPLANDLGAASAVVVSAVVLVACVYQYITGCVDSGGSKAYSSGALDFRDTYISILLFRGAHVWIKSRDVASNKPVPKGGVRTVVTLCKDGGTKVKYEPRFKPRKEKSGLCFTWIYLGQFEEHAEAEVIYRIAASCYEYGKVYGPLDLGDGREFFPIPEMTADEQSLSGKEKLAWVKNRVPRVYELYKKEKDARNPPPTLPGTDLEQQNQHLRSQNLQLQWEVLHERQQKEELASQLHQLQQVQEPTAQDLELQSQYLQQQQLSQVLDSGLQQQQREEEPLLWEELLVCLTQTPIQRSGRR